MTNATEFRGLPQEPVCSLYPRPSLVPGVSDVTLATVGPTIVYSIFSAVFHWIDVNGFFEQYKIHPSQEVLQRNHASRKDVALSVVRYHIMSIGIGLLLNYGSEPELTGGRPCEVFRWAAWIRKIQQIQPVCLGLSLLGIDAKGLAFAVHQSNPRLAQFLDKRSPVLPSTGTLSPSAVSSTEMFLAEMTHSILVPAFQFFVALAVVDTWIYFTHRLCHTNKSLYRFVHAQHHRLYVSYAYGAVYGHVVESLFLDVLSFILANTIAQLSARQSLAFGSLATIKTIMDHCGYVFPWDPFRLINANDANFHDLHHQSWGLKHNFSTYTTFWDNVIGSAWADSAESQARYERVRVLTARRAEKCVNPQELLTDKATDVAVASGVDAQT